MIGDARHRRQRYSDHNPDSKGCVHALDITARGIDTTALISAAITDKRVRYVIFNRRIWIDGSWQAYHGDGPHIDHIHISIYHTDYAENNTNHWNINKGESEMIQEIKNYIAALLVNEYHDARGKHYGIGRVVEENQRRIDRAYASTFGKLVVWRNGKSNSALQELADCKTLLLRNEARAIKMDKAITALCEHYGIEAGEKDGE